MCEQLGQEPDPEKMPPTLEEFSYEVQVAFFIYELLPVRFDGMSGMFLGRDISAIEFLYKTYKVMNRRAVTELILSLNNKYILHHNKKAEAERKRAERKAQAGKTTTVRNK